MLGIMRKDALVYLLMAAFAVLLPLIDAFKAGLGAHSVVTTALWTFILVIPAVQCEFVEHLTRGYRLLRVLPLTTREIVWAKHLWPLTIVSLHVAYAGFLFAVLAPAEQVRRLSRAYLVLNGNLALLIAAVMLFLVFRFGLSRWSKAALIAIPVMGMFMLGESVIRLDLLERIAGFGSWPVLVVVTALSLGLYALLAMASVRAFEQREV
jgi:hypothetical protein